MPLCKLVVVGRDTPFNNTTHLVWCMYIDFKGTAIRSGSMRKTVRKYNGQEEAGGWLKACQL